jgi:hypothetical protein
MSDCIEKIVGKLSNLGRGSYKIITFSELMDAPGFAPTVNFQQKMGHIEDII